MSIEDKDIKLLWGRAAGRCSLCKIDLTYTLSTQETISIGEMAHIIARKENGPRGSEKIASELLNAYSNLILLCNNHHEMIDKAPQCFSVEEILNWKKTHEEEISIKLAGEHFKDKDALFEAIKKLLLSNNAIYKQYGPQSEVAMRNPTSNAKNMWDALKLSTLLPNNRKIINIIEENLSYLSTEEYEIFLQFKMHAMSFEENAYERSDNESVLLFPNSFREMIYGGLQLMGKNTDKPRIESINFFEEVLADHSNVISFNKDQDQVYTIKRRNGKTLKVYLTDLYTIGLADYHLIKNRIPNLDAIITVSNWNGYTEQVKFEALKINFGIFTMGEFWGALNRERFASYVKYTSEGKPIYHLHESDDQ